MPLFSHQHAPTPFPAVIFDHEGDGDGIRTLRAALKILLRRFGLRAVKVEQTSDTD